MSATDSLASNFFASLSRDTAEAYAKLASLVGPDSPYRESEWIEYKSGFYQNIDKVGVEWSRQLSGFANSGDGILIWGINTKPFKKFDMPDKIVLVKDAELLAGELERLKSFAVEPPVHGVKILPITNQTAAGFVIAFIPESPRKPHQVRLNDPDVQDRFYIRNGHQTEPARQSLLRILFYPQFNPQVELSAQLHNENTPHASLALYLRNVGPVSISELYVVVTNQGKKVHFNFDPSLFIKDREALDAIGVHARQMLHPQLSVSLGGIPLDADANYMVNVFGKDIKPFRWRIKATSEQKRYLIESVE